MPELDFVISAKRAPDAASEQQHGAPDGRPDSRPERRAERRLPGPRQVWIQGTDANGDNVEEVQVMRNYSVGGFYFVTHMHWYRAGMQLNVIPSFGSLNIEYVAEVVRVEPRARMAYGVGVKLLHVHNPIPRPNSA
jgi:hypothetical protein